MSNSSYQRSFHEIFDGEFHLCLSKFFIRDRKPTNRVCSLSPPKVGTHSALTEKSYTAAHTSEQGKSLLLCRVFHSRSPIDQIKAGVSGCTPCCVHPLQRVEKVFSPR